MYKYMLLILFVALLLVARSCQQEIEFQECSKLYTSDIDLQTNCGGFY